MVDLDTVRTEVALFVQHFHADLAGWFSGEMSKDTVWPRLQTASERLRLVYPSGTRLDGQAFLDTIENRWGTSPGFRAWVEEIEVLQANADHAVVAYVEAQTGARHSTSKNRRAAMALVRRTATGWAWDYIQETALAD